MAANKLIFKDAEAARDAITKSQQKQIAELYEKWAKEVEQKALDIMLKGSITDSNQLEAANLVQLQRQLQASSAELNKAVEAKVKQSIHDVAEATVAANKAWLKSLGFDDEGLNAAFTNVPNQIVQKLVSGQIYDSGWSLNKRIWSDNQDTQKKLYEIVAGGIAQNKSAYEISKMLEKYVSPSAAKQWNLKAKDGKRIYPKQVDYNAQRLARTLAQHSYQQSFKEMNDTNPFVQYYMWDANGSRVCPICQARDGNIYGKGPTEGSIQDTGVQSSKYDSLPMDHPMGMCTMVPVIVDDLINKIANWANSEPGTFPEIDKYADEFGWKPSIPKDLTVDDVINKWGKSSKTMQTWMKQLSPQEKAEVKALKDKTGLSWDKWYKQNIFEGNALKLSVKSANIPKFDKNEWMSKLRQNDISVIQSKFDDIISKMSNEEKEAFKRYTGSSFKDINSYLRGIDSYVNSYNKDAIKFMNEAFDKFKLDAEYVVRRGTRSDSLFGMLGVDSKAFYSDIAKNPDKVIGNIVKDGGFMSTTPDIKGGFSRNVEIIVKLPEGSRAIYIDSISQFQGEKEMLIGSDTSFIIEDFTSSNSNFTLFLRALV